MAGSPVYLFESWVSTLFILGTLLSTLYNLVVSFLLTASHDTDGCRINTILQLDEGKKIIFFSSI